MITLNEAISAMSRADSTMAFPSDEEMKEWKAAIDDEDETSSALDMLSRINAINLYFRLLQTHYPTDDMPMNTFTELMSSATFLATKMYSRLMDEIMMRDKLHVR